jgi:hypothetical protein
MRFLVDAVLRPLRTLLRALAMLACLVCAGGVSGQVAAQAVSEATILSLAAGLEGARCDAAGHAELMASGACEQPAGESPEQPIRSTGTPSEEDDQHDAGDGDLAASFATQTTRVVHLYPVRCQLPVQDRLLLSDHHTLEPRPPRA